MFTLLTTLEGNVIMPKYALQTAILAACCAMTHNVTAAEWSFQWQGFDHWDGVTATPVPTLTLGGKFSAVDTNNDNAISLDELVSLEIDSDGSLTDCHPSRTCSITSFSYSKTDGLRFTAQYSWRYYDESSHHWKTEVYYFKPPVSFSFDLWGQGTWPEAYTYLFTPRTRETITLLSAVPEPATYAMLGAGLLLLGPALRRRNRRVS